MLLTGLADSKDLLFSRCAAVPHLGSVHVKRFDMQTELDHATADQWLAFFRLIPALLVDLVGERMIELCGRAALFAMWVSKKRQSTESMDQWQQQWLITAHLDNAQAQKVAGTGIRANPKSLV